MVERSFLVASKKDVRTHVFSTLGEYVDKQDISDLLKKYIALDFSLRKTIPERKSCQLSRETVLDRTHHRELLGLTDNEIDGVWWWITEHWKYLCLEADKPDNQGDDEHPGQGDVKPLDPDALSEKPVDQDTILYSSRLRDRGNIAKPGHVYERFMTQTTKPKKSRKRKLKPGSTLGFEHALKMVKNHKGYRVVDLTHDEESNSSDSLNLQRALEVIGRHQKRFRVIDLTQPNDDMSMSSDNSSDGTSDEMEDDSDISIPISILDAIRSNDRDHLKQPLQFGVRCGCGMMLLDSDVKRTPEELNMLLRRQNVGVCILRSKLACGELSQMPHEQMLEQSAKMGAFSEAVGKWGLKDDFPQDVLQKLNRSGLSRPPTPQEPVLESATDKSFKAWWEGVCNSHNINGTTWPSKCSASLSATHLTEQQVLARCRTLLKTEAKTDEDHAHIDTLSLDDCVMRLVFATLIGGDGSPPHIDTMHNIVAMEEDEKALQFNLALAVGYVIQGHKYFWCLPPKGGHTQKFLDFYRHRKAVGQTVEESKYRSAIRHGRVPPPYQQAHSFGWSNVTDWDDMVSSGICNHFHPLRAGDLYVITEGTLHAAINDLVYHPVSVAYDDRWWASHSDLHQLQPWVCKP